MIKSSVSSFLVCSQPEAQVADQPLLQEPPPRALPFRTFTSPLHPLSHTHPGKHRPLADARKETSLTNTFGFDVHVFIASAVSIEMSLEPCLETRPLVTMAAPASVSALTHQTPSWIRKLGGEKRRSLCTAPRPHMVHVYHLCVCVSLDI